MKQILAVISVSLLASFSLSAKYSNLPARLSLPQQVAEQPITICYYRPKVWMGPGQLGFETILDGHIQCKRQDNFGVLYYFKHTYR